MSPFDSKNRVATALDRLALRVLLFLLSVGYFFALWHSGVPSLLAGSALFALAMLTLLLLERRTLARRDHALRVRVGGAIALEELMLLPAAEAEGRVCLLLAETLGGAAQGSVLSYAGKTYLVRCAQTLPGSAAGEGDVLAAHRAKAASGAELCILAGTGGFSPAAQRAAEWMEPPIRLIAGRQLALLFGQQHPATDAEIARRARRQRTPFSRGRIRALALAPAKQGRYLLVAFLLALLYLFLRSFLSLAFALTAFVLAMLCARENRKSFRLELTVNPPHFLGETAVRRVRDEHRQQVQPRPAALFALDEHQLGRVLRSGNDEAHALGLDLRPAHRVAERQKPRRGKDGAQPPAVLQHARAGRYPIRKRAIRIASGKRAGFLRADQPRAERRIRRVGHDELHGLAADDSAGLAAVGVMHANPRLKPVERHAPLRHIRHIPLHLESVERRSLRPRAEQQRQNARPRAHVADALAAPHRREIRQQHRVRAEAEAVLPLDDAQAVALQIVNALARLQCRLHVVSPFGAPESDIRRFAAARDAG